MKFTINGQIVDNSKSTKITIPKKKIISCNDWFYNKNNNRTIKEYAKSYYTENIVWNYFEIKIDFSKFPDKTAYLFIYPYHSGTLDHNIVPYQYIENISIPVEYNCVDPFSNNFDDIYNFSNPTSSVSFTKICGVIMIRSDEDKFYIKTKSKFILCPSYDDYTVINYIPKINNQKDILILGIGSRYRYDDKEDGGAWGEYLKINQAQFLFINAEDKNLNNSFKVKELINTRNLNGSFSSIVNSHNFAWKFGILNNSDSDIDINVASYKNDLTDTLDRLCKETYSYADGDALLEIERKPEYDIKQILPLIKDENFNEDFLNYDGLKIRCKSNYAEINKNDRYFGPLFDIDGSETYGCIPPGNRYKPLEFWLDFGINVNNLVGISFHPAVVNSRIENFEKSCSVKDYEIYISKDNIKYQLLAKNTYDISKGKDENYIFLFKPEKIIFDPIAFRYLKIKILNYYFNNVQGYTDGSIGFAKLRIYTNTKNLYNKESDQSISNYKDNSFNQITTKPEYDQKSKEDKIIINKQASFDIPSISKIKNELNDFRIITNHNNIPIYEKT